MDDRLIAETPCRNIALSEIIEDKVVPLTTQQGRALASAAPEDLEALVVFGAGTGLRSGEIVGLPVEAVDFLRREVCVEQQLVYIPGTGVFLAPPKTKAGVRTVPVPNYALEALSAHLGTLPTDRDFTAVGGPRRGGDQGEAGVPRSQGWTDPADDPQRPLGEDGEAGGRSLDTPRPAPSLRFHPDRRR